MKGVDVIPSEMDMAGVVEVGEPPCEVDSMGRIFTLDYDVLTKTLWL